MPDFQYQPPTGPLSGSEFERQTTRFFQQVQGAADAAQSTAIVAQTTANEALERAQASNFVDGKTTEAGGVITVKDVAIGGNLEDLASARTFKTVRKFMMLPYLQAEPAQRRQALLCPATLHRHRARRWLARRLRAEQGRLSRRSMPSRLRIRGRR